MLIARLSALTHFKNFRVFIIDTVEMVIARLRALLLFKYHEIRCNSVCRNANCSTDGIDTILVTTLTRAIIS